MGVSYCADNSDGGRNQVYAHATCQSVLSNVSHSAFSISDFLHFQRCDYKDLASARLENVTQTIARVLEGYDIRLRPDFGGKFD